MVIYAEFVFITNFFADLTVVAITSDILRCKRNGKRKILTALLGAMIATILPFFLSKIVIFKLISIIILPIFLKKNGSFFEYLITLCVFLCVTLLIGGMMYGLKTSITSYSGENDASVIVILFSIATLAVSVVCREIIEKLYSYLKKREREYFVTISDGRTEGNFSAFYDSGNRVYAKNGEPVTIVAFDVYNMFVGQEENVFVQTINGMSELKSKDVKIVIYSDTNENMIYRTKIASAPNIKVKERILLHGDMIGG